MPMGGWPILWEMLAKMPDMAHANLSAPKPSLLLRPLRAGVALGCGGGAPQPQSAAQEPRNPLVTKKGPCKVPYKIDCNDGMDGGHGEAIYGRELSRRPISPSEA